MDPGKYFPQMEETQTFLMKLSIHFWLDEMSLYCPIMLQAQAPVNKSCPCGKIKL